ncbi:MAG: tetratricopeptide repeat protein [Saprospiraceae bacterium]|nr:MAG: tetratricopeptide repeat protein [Saprospiraceae bacterium]
MLRKSLFIAFRAILWMAPLMGAQAQRIEVGQASPAVVDSTGIDSLFTLSDASVGQGELAAHYAWQALEWSKKTGDVKRQGLAYSHLANFFLRQSDLNSAITYADSAGLMYEKVDYPQGLAKNHNLFAVIFAAFGKTKEAENYYQRALEIYRQSGDLIGVQKVLNNRGVLFNEQKQFAKAKADHLKALAMAETARDTNLQARSLHNLGISCQGLGETGQAYGFLKRSYLLRKSQANYAGISECLTNIAKVVAASQASPEFQRSQQDYLRSLGFSSVFQMMDTSLYYAQKGQNQDLVFRNYEAQLALLEQAGQYKEALHFEKLRNQLQEKLKLNDNNLSSFVNLWSRLQSEHQQNKILALENKQVQEKLASQHKTRQRNLLLGTLLGVLLIASVLYQSYKRKLLAGTLELELKNKQLSQMEQRQQIAAMNAMLEGQEYERERVSKDLHDSLGNLLSTIKMHLSNLPANGNNLQFVNELVDDACIEVRKIALDMMPATLLRFGIPKALQELSNRQNNANGCHIHFQSFGKIGRLELPREIMVFRICQELLQNTLKHANATEVIVQLTQVDDFLHLTVEDDGAGFLPGAVNKESSLGLRSIESRVQFLEGKWNIESSPGQGTTAVIEIPLVPVAN